MAKWHLREADMASRSKRQGGFHSLNDVHRGPLSGFDGEVMRAVFGNDPLDFAKCIEHELEQQQWKQPGRFVKKIGARSGGRTRAKP